MAAVPTDIEIARAATMQPIWDIGAKLDIPEDALMPYGRFKAKISAEYRDGLKDRPDGKLILVTAMTPTPAGEGKTTTTVGLGDGLNRIGKKAMICLREPSLGPCFGVKGGAAGGGYAQVVPMEDINLHFTGDFHAITSAHNLLSAMIDNHIYWGNDLGIDSRRVTWGRVVDMNDRALRDVVVSLGGVTNGFARQTGFDITVASEVMAIFCISEDLEDLERRPRQDRRRPYPRPQADPRARFLRRRRHGRAAQGCDPAEPGPDPREQPGADPWRPLRQHRARLQFGHRHQDRAQDGGLCGDGSRLRRRSGRREKFFDIKCRKAGLSPDAAVIVATIRALKMHGGVARDDLGAENVDAVNAGLENLGRHIRNVGQFGVPAVVAVNRFTSDSDQEVAAVKAYCEQFHVKAFECTHWADGGVGTEGLANAVVQMADSGSSQFRPLYDDSMSLWEKARTVARSIYGADDIIADKKVRDQFAAFEGCGRGQLSGLHGQDPVQLLDRPEPERRAQQPCGADPRSAAVERRGVSGRDLRRSHDHAGSSARAGREWHPHQ